MEDSQYHAGNCHDDIKPLIGSTDTTMQHVVDRLVGSFHMPKSANEKLLFHCTAYSNTNQIVYSDSDNKVHHRACMERHAQATYKKRAAELKELYNDRLKVFKAECSTALKTSNSWKSARCYGE